MLELRLTDQELQALVAPRLVARLRKAGFKMGRTEGEFPSSMFVPISLDLVGWCSFTRDADGFWTIQQDETRIAEVVADAHEMHYEAITGREAPRA